MTAYNPGTPQPPDIPNESQDDFELNFKILNDSFAVDHIAFGNTVTFATNSNPCVCTSPIHGLQTGYTVNIVHFCSLIADILTPWAINGGPYVVTVIDANTFSIPVNSSAEGPYFPDSGAFSSPNFNYGFHTKTFFPNVVQQGPNTAPTRGAPFSAYYSKSQEYIDPIDTLKKFAAQMFFQNNVGIAFEKQLTQLEYISNSNINGSGIKTPWGLIFNFGQIAFSNAGTDFDLPIPFSSQFLSLSGTLFSDDPSLKLQQLVLTQNGLTQFNAKYFVSNKLTAGKAYYLAIGI